EDPYLAARMTEALVEGAGRAGVAVVLKHFAGQGATVGGRNSAATELGPRELHEVHLAAARAGVAAGAAGVMAAYNEFDGLPCVASRYLLTDLLRSEWGFEGVVMADGTAVDRLVRLTGDPVAAGALALDAGCDLSLWDDSFARLGEAVDRGLVSEAALDAAVARVLTLKFRLGLFEAPLPPAVRGSENLPDPGETGERLARASVTLLSHEGGVLPLSRAVRRISVLGPNADSLAQQIGDYTAPQRPGSGITVLEGIRAAVAPGTEVVHGPGCGLVGDDVSDVPAAVALAA
ncbi:beta-glucosidase, partial [Streptomyces sp. SID6013]|nr:beta-glucosidase [Streptomyces sp. SID6013]